MTTATSTLASSWDCRPTWRSAAYNTSWCLLGCSAGDMGTILFFQLSGLAWPVWLIMSLAIINGLLTSIALETVILARQMALRLALRTAMGMSAAYLSGMAIPNSTRVETPSTMLRILSASRNSVRLAGFEVLCDSGPSYGFDSAMDRYFRSIRRRQLARFDDT